MTANVLFSSNTRRRCASGCLQCAPVVTEQEKSAKLAVEAVFLRKIPIEAPLARDSCQKQSQFRSCVDSPKQIVYQFASERVTLMYLSCFFSVPVSIPDVTVTVDGPTSLFVAWTRLPIDRARGTITGHRVIYRPLHGDDETFNTVEVNGDVFEYILTGQSNHCLRQEIVERVTIFFSVYYWHLYKGLVQSHLMFEWPMCVWTLLVRKFSWPMDDDVGVARWTGHALVQ